MAAPSPLLNLTVAVPVDGGVTSLQSKPSAQWYGISQIFIFNLFCESCLICLKIILG